jgi:hypothetical protein
VSRRTARRIASIYWVAFLVLLGASVPLALLNRTLTLDSALVLVLLLAFGTVGALVVAGRPENWIGWIFCAGALLWVFGQTGQEYAMYALETRPGALPLGIWAAWLASWTFDIGWFLLLTFTFLLFPTGHLPSRRWRPVAWIAAFFIVTHVMTKPFAPGPLEALPSAINPVGVEAAGVALWISDQFTFLLLGTIAISMMSIVVRFRYATGLERQQLKWITYVVGVLLMLFAASSLIGELLGSDAYPLALEVALLLSFVAFPIAVSIAILRYRLYDIDIIINRTLVYGLLTMALATVYVGCVVLLRSVLAPLTGSSELAIVTSTLAIAALFNPLRRRIQATIDKRFFRRKYDATKVLAAFGRTVRDETDLEALTSEMLHVVDETMQPETVGLWLRAGETEVRR